MSESLNDKEKERNVDTGVCCKLIESAEVNKKGEINERQSEDGAVDEMCVFLCVFLCEERLRETRGGGGGEGGRGNFILSE